MNNHFFADARPQVRYWIPEGYVTEAGLRADVQALARRGFGALELVAVNFFNTPMSDECRWGTQRYYEAVRVVLREAAACGMAVDLANGPGWPISVPQITSADDPATLYEFTYGVAALEASQITGPIALPKRRMVRDEGRPQLIAVCAYQLVGEKLLDVSTYVDLLPLVHDGMLSWWPPQEGSADKPATWAIFAFWGQPACHKVLNRHFVIDHLSTEGALASVAWWEHELLPALGDEARHLRSFFCDSLEYRVTMEWTRDFAQAFKAHNGYSILPYLPVVGEPGTYPKNDVAGYAFTDVALTRAVRHDYAKTLSWMYAERHVRTLCMAARRLGKTVRYQVAYNKPFAEEDAAALVDVPENESLGRQTLDNLRVMAGAAHLTRKPRYSFEAAAEFGSGYGQTQRDLLWWLKRAALAGCNAQVLHGASYGGHGMDDVAWPGWEAWNRLCSNNWNRTLSECSFAQLADAVTRLNELRRARALVDVAFLRDAYLNDGHGADGAHVVHDDGLLCAHGYSYEFLSPALLAHPNAHVAHGRLDPDGAAYKALVVAEQDGMGTAALHRLRALAREGLPVFVVGTAQLRPHNREDLGRRNAWQNAHDKFLACKNVRVVHDYAELLAALEAAGIEPDARYDAPAVFSAHVRRGGENGSEDLYLLYNGNRVQTGADGKGDPATFMPGVQESGALAPVTLQVALAGTGHAYAYDLVSGQEYALASTEVGGRIELLLPLEADQLVVVGLRHDVSGLPARTWDGLTARPLANWALTLYELQESSDPCDFLAGGYVARGSFGPLTELPWWDELQGAPADFAGYGTYRTTVELEAVPAQAYLQLPLWNDALELEVNGQELPVVAGLANAIDVRAALRAGTNELVIRVYSNLSNRLDAAGREQFHTPLQRYGLQGTANLLTTP